MTLEQVFDIIYTAETIEEAKERIFAFEREEREQGDLRIRRIVREELEKQSKTEHRSFGKSLSAIIREIEAELEASE